MLALRGLLTPSVATVRRLVAHTGTVESKKRFLPLFSRLEQSPLREFVLFDSEDVYVEYVRSLFAHSVLTRFDGVTFLLPAQNAHR